jgi:ubiquinone/menaquinone biosynthesis C-methylase UbiE
MAAPYIELISDTAGVHDDDDRAFIERHLSDRSGPVLDVGCGPGHLTTHLRSLGADAIGVDLVPEFLDHARTADATGRYVRASLHALPFADGSTGGLLAWYSLIHLQPDEIDGVLVELRRVLAPGAPLVVGFFDGLDDADRVGGLDAEPFDHKVVTAYRWPVDVLAARLRAAGFVEVEREQRPGIDEAGRRPHAALALEGT